MQLNLPPPPLIHITFSGQPAVSTGVVNLAALLGSTDYLLVRHVSPTEGAGGAYDDDDNENDSLIDGGEDTANKADINSNKNNDKNKNNNNNNNNNNMKHNNVNNGDGVSGNSSLIGEAVSQRRKLQLCDHAGLPLGCFAVEDGGRYEVVRRSDVHVGAGVARDTREEKKKRKRNTREEEEEEEEEGKQQEKEENEEEEEQELTAEERRKKKRQEKRRKRAEKAREADRGENRSALLRSRGGNEATNTNTNTNTTTTTTTTTTINTNTSTRGKESTVREGGEGNTRMENAVGEEGVQRVSLDTPLTDSLTNSQRVVEQSEQQQQQQQAEEKEEEKEKEEYSGNTPSRPSSTQKSLSPSLVSSPMPVMEVKKCRRPLNKVSSSSSLDRNHVQYVNEEQQDEEQERRQEKELFTAEQENENEKENENENEKEEKEEEKQNSHTGENRGVEEQQIINKPSNLRSSVASTTTDDDTLITHALKNAVREKEKKDEGSSSKKRNSKNHNDHDSLLDVLKKNINTTTITRTPAASTEPEATPIREEGKEEEEEEEMWSEATGQQRPSSNKWMPLESPALGFTTVDNTLSQDFSLDSSSVTSSTDQVY